MKEQRTALQRINLLRLALRIGLRRRPLGVGMKNQCWGAVATHLARQHGRKVTDFYGITFTEFRTAIKDNKRTPVAVRNRVMMLGTLRMAGLGH